MQTFGRMLALVFVCWCVHVGWSQEQLDFDFANNGVFRTNPFLGQDNFFRDLIVLPNEEIIAVGSVDAIDGSGQDDMLIVKLEENGTLDATFGNGGIVRLDIQGSDVAFAVAHLNNGKIVVGGRSAFESFQRVACVVMLNADGSLDETFSEDGIYRSPLTLSGSSYVSDILEDEEGNLLIGGQSAVDIHIFKLDLTGKLVESYALDGRITIPNDFPLNCRGMALQQDGKLLVAGKVNRPNDDIMVLRLNQDGTLDESFAAGSFFFYDMDQEPNGSHEIAESIMVDDENGRILLGGQTRYFGESYGHFYILALDENGQFDPTFGEQGIQQFPATGYSFGNDTEMLPSGRIVLVGGFESIGDGDSNLSIVQFTNQGAIDFTLGNSGLQLFDFPENSFERSESVKLQNDEKLLVAGTFLRSGGNWTGFVLRLEVEEVTKTGTALVNDAFDIFPNPASDEISLVFPGGQSTERRVEIYDLAGRLVLAKDLAAGQTIDVSQLPSGLYSAIVLQKGQYLMRRFVKM